MFTAALTPLVLTGYWEKKRNDLGAMEISCSVLRNNFELSGHSGYRTVAFIRAQCYLSLLFHLIPCVLHILHLVRRCGWQEKQDSWTIPEDKTRLKLQNQEADKWKQRTQSPLGRARWESHNSSMKCQTRNLKGTEWDVGMLHEASDGRCMEWGSGEAGKSPVSASPRGCSDEAGSIRDWQPSLLPPMGQTQY